MSKRMMFGGAEEGGFTINDSLLLDSSASQYLSRTPGSAGNRKTWTFSAWVKRGKSGVQQTVLKAGPGPYVFITFEADDALQFEVNDGSTSSVKKTSAVFRDPSAWYNLVFACDTTLTTATDRMKIYINGSLATSFVTNSVTFAQNYDTAVNNTVAQYIGSNSGVNLPFDGYLSDVYLIDGQALDPSYFGETNAQGSLSPKAYGGTYGTNGFHLDFSNPSALGEDAAGSNDWTTNGGINSSNQVADTPTDNFCVLNPLTTDAGVESYGNLKSTGACRSTFDANAFASYWEVTSSGTLTAGIINATGSTHTTSIASGKTYGFRITGSNDLDYINITDAGSWTSITTGLTGEWFPYATGANNQFNFGQRTFTGTPSGLDLSTANLPSAEAIITSGTFTGNANADGPFVWTNGSLSTLTINGNAVTWGTHADKLANGFKLRTSSASYNTAGSNTWTATGDIKFKYENAQINP